MKNKISEIKKGQRILALDENEIYIVEHNVRSTDKKESNSFDFLTKKEKNGITRGFSFEKEDSAYTRLNHYA
ncbi:hypothetical protein ACTHOQ_14110 [Solibacillus silvestris]|uniref:hypothetical protein n=1 Tax=Solibacillus silvestris TaxID=76853 RepID=UPI003F7E1A22